MLTRDVLLRLHRDMVRVRVIDERIAALYAEQEMRCPVHLSVGQEAVAAGVSAALEARDYVLSGHRAHAHYIARGCDVRAMMAELYGRVTGCAGGKGGSMHLIDVAAGFLGAVPIVGSTIPIGVGAAFGAVARGEDRVTIVYLGEGATEEGAFHEAINYAALRRLPVVFVCENNFFSVYSPLSVRQPEGRQVWQQAAAYGVEAAKGDGNDACGVYQRTRQAVDKARGGGGPTFLEFTTYRWREHCGPNYDDNLGYRRAGEPEEWKKKDPIPRHETLLLAEGAAIRAELDQVWRAAEAECEDAVRFAKDSPFPEEKDLWANLYPDAAAVRR